MKFLTHSIFYILTGLVLAQRALGLQLVIEPKVHSEITTYSFESVPPDTNVGAFTIEALKLKQIPFEGAADGITSIRGLKSQYEIISNTRVKFWGWCFSVDGTISNEMPDETPLKQDAKILKWFYGYANYDSGIWTGMCLQDPDRLAP